MGRSKLKLSCLDARFRSITASFLFSGKPVSWALLNPSVSPFKVSANGLLLESSNPSVRLYRYDSFTGEVSLTVQFVGPTLINMIFLYSFCSQVS